MGKNKLKKFLSLFLALVIFMSFASCVKKEDKEGNSGVKNKQETNISKNKEVKNKEYEKLLDLSNKGKYDDIIGELEKRGISNLTEKEKSLLLNSYLNKGNYYYKQKEVRKRVEKLLSTMKETSEVLHQKGYLKEINRDFSGALEDYNKALSFSGITDKEKSLILAQIGHTYDLKGDFSGALEDYNKAYELDKTNYLAVSNLARVHYRKGELGKSKRFMEKSLVLTSDLPEKSEIYYGLSNLELRLNGLKPNIDKSIEYAKKSIEVYPDYPMGYLAYAKGLYMKNDKKYYDEIESNLKKAIELNPNSTYAYEYYALLEFDKKNYDNVEKYIFKAINVVSNDMILMKSDIESIRNRIFSEAVLIGKIRTAKNDDEIIDFIKEAGGIKSDLMLSQLKRENYGAFSNLKDNKKFQELLK